jgi:hypothetical protein
VQLGSGRFGFAPGYFLALFSNDFIEDGHIFSVVMQRAAKHLVWCSKL